MTTDDIPDWLDDRLAQLEGRIIAVELISTWKLWEAATDLANGVGDRAKLAEIKMAMFDSLQHLDRPIDPRSEAIWGYAVDALGERFDNADQRMAGAAQIMTAAADRGRGGHDRSAQRRRRLRDVFAAFALLVALPAAVAALVAWVMADGVSLTQRPVATIDSSIIRPPVNGD